MFRRKLSTLSTTLAPDDRRLMVIKRDVSGGINTRMHASQINANQCEELTNIDIGTPGQRRKRNGSVLIGSDVGSDTVVALHDYQRQGYTDQLMMVEDTHLWASENEGEFIAVKNDFVADADVGIVSVKESGLTPDDVIMVNVGEGNWFRFHKASGGTWDEDELSTANTSPPQSTVGCWYGNRFWVLKDDLLYYSDAYSADYDGAFDQSTEWFRIPVGDERGIVPTRDKGMIIMGKNAIWNLFPSAVPAATDRPEPIVSNHGVVSKKGWCVAGDNIYYFAQDGFRELKRTATDDLQTGTTYPLSYLLKDEFDEISWTYITNLSMVAFDNKIFINVPTGASTYSTWIYYPALNSFSKLSDWNPRCMATHKIDGELRLYYGKVADGKVYRGWYGYTDEGTTTTNGTAIEMTEVGKEEDFGQPLIKKVGGEIEIEAETCGDGNSLTVYASVNGGSFDTSWTVSLTNSTAPTLPINLPFFLADSYVIREKFSIDSLGEFRTLQVKVVNSNSNISDVILYSVNMITFPQEYENE